MSAGLASMTGYARAAVSLPAAALVCEVKSVNGRGLDLRLRLPPGLDALEGELRQRLGRALTRGSITLTLTVERDAMGGDLVLNRQALDTVLATIEELRTRLDVAPPSLDGILAIKGVLEPRERLSPEDG